MCRTQARSVLRNSQELDDRIRGVAERSGSNLQGECFIVCRADMDSLDETVDQPSLGDYPVSMPRARRMHRMCQKAQSERGSQETDDREPATGAILWRKTLFKLWRAHSFST